MKYISALAIGLISLSFAACASLPGSARLTVTDLEVYRTIVRTLDDMKALVFRVHRELVLETRVVCDPESATRLWQGHQFTPKMQTIDSYCQLSSATLSTAQAKRIGERWPMRTVLLAERTTSGVVLSTIAYDLQQTEALVSVSHDYEGHLFLLRRSGGRWSVVDSFFLWIA